MSTADVFLSLHGMEAGLIDIPAVADAMMKDMKAGLRGEKSDMPMIPTFLSNDGSIPEGTEAVVIDAGGTNFRSCLVEKTGDGFHVHDLYRNKMPGTSEPVQWEEFVAFTANSIEKKIQRSTRVGYCFSYAATVTEDIDAIVHKIDKEVTVFGCEGKKVGEELRKELAKRGFADVRTVILNDTVAVLLGGASGIDKRFYSGFIGQVSGTGTNTCATVPVSQITKLGLSGANEMIVNLESGMYSALPMGDFDIALDKESANPGEKILEKHTAGVYLGRLAAIMVRTAFLEGYLTQDTADRIAALGGFDTAVVNEWAEGETAPYCSNAADAEFLCRIAQELLLRSACCMCSNLLGISLLTGAGNDSERPILVCAEGSLVQKSRFYRTRLESLLKDNADKLGKSFFFQVMEGTTITGAAAAAMLNI